MKLHNSLGPNPRLVRMFIAEKGIEIPEVEVDLMGGENRRPPYTDKNPGGQLPSLELDDGTWIAETTAVCEYIEELHPTPALIGTTPQERAETRMWTRRIDLAICENMANGFRYAEGKGLFEGRMRMIPQAADDLKTLAQEKLEWLDGLIAGRDFIGGDQLRLTDIKLFAFLDFFKGAGQPLVEKNANVMAWFQRMDARPSAAASLHGAAKAAGMNG